MKKTFFDTIKDLTPEKRFEKCNKHFNYGYKPKSLPDLVAFIKKTRDAPWDYDGSVRRDTACLTALWNWLMKNSGHSGYSASAVGLDFLGYTRHMPWGFLIIDPEDAMYPQYSYIEKLEEYLNDEKMCKDRIVHLKKELRNKKDVSPSVVSHWKQIIKNNGKIDITHRTE